MDVDQIVDKGVLEYEPELDEEQYLAAPKSAQEIMALLRIFCKRGNLSAKSVYF